jgi:hypothetical protein
MQLAFVTISILSMAYDSDLAASYSRHAGVVTFMPQSSDRTYVYSELSARGEYIVAASESPDNSLKTVLTKISPLPKKTTAIYVADKSGLYLTADSRGEFKGRRCVIKYPVDISSKWNGEYTSPAGSAVKYESRITAVRFNCLCGKKALCVSVSTTLVINGNIHKIAEDYGSGIGIVSLAIGPDLVKSLTGIATGK